jgi:hypothetical protein
VTEAVITVRKPMPLIMMKTPTARPTVLCGTTSP